MRIPASWDYAKMFFDVRGPDLPGQHRRGPYGVEGDFLEEGRGWQGPYVRKLLKKQRREQPLGERTVKTYWNYNKKWAIELGFKVSFQAIFNSHLLIKFIGFRCLCCREK